MAVKSKGKAAGKAPAKKKGAAGKGASRAPARSRADAAGSTARQPGRRQGGRSRAKGAAGQADVLAVLDQEVKKGGSDHDQATMLCSRALFKEFQGDLAGAIADYDQAIELGAKDIMIFSKRGMARLESGDHAGAIADFDRILEGNPDAAFALQYRSQARAATDDLAGAAADLERAIRLEPDDHGKHEALADIRMRQDDLQGALAALDRAVELNPGRSTSARKSRNAVLDALKELRESIADLDRIMRDDPNPAAAALRAQARMFAGDLAGAREDAERAIKLGTEESDTLALRDRIRQREEGIKGARAGAGEAGATDPDSPATDSRQGSPKGGRR